MSLVPLTRHQLIALEDCSDQELQTSVENLKVKIKLPRPIRDLLKSEVIQTHERQMLIDWLASYDYKSVETQVASDSVHPPYAHASMFEPGSPTYTEVAVFSGGRYLVVCFKPTGATCVDVWLKGFAHYLSLSKQPTAGGWSTSTGARQWVNAGDWIAFLGKRPFNTDFSGLVGGPCKDAKVLYQSTIELLITRARAASGRL